MTQLTKAQLNQQLLAAAKANDLTTAQAQLELGADLSAADQDGTTAAILFGWNGNDFAVLELAQQDADVLKQQNSAGYTPTIWLAADANQKVDGILALAKINPEVLLQKTTHGDSPAILLAFSGHINGVLALAAINPEVLTQRDDKGFTPAHWLARNRYDIELAALAEKHPEVLTIPDHSGITVMQYYVQRKRLRMVRALVRAVPETIYEPGVKPFLRKYDKTIAGCISRMFWRDEPQKERATKKRPTPSDD